MRIFNNVLQIYSFLKNNAAILSIGSQTVEFPLDTCFPATLGLDFIHQFLGFGKEIVHLPGQLFALFGIRDALQLTSQI